MRRIDNQGSSTAVTGGVPRGNSPARGMLLTLPIAGVLWSLIILAAFAIFKGATPA